MCGNPFISREFSHYNLVLGESQAPDALLGLAAGHCMCGTSDERLLCKEVSLAIKLIIMCCLLFPFKFNLFSD
jgi:hypothetical protein